MPVETRSDIADTPPQGRNGVWNLRERRLEAWRNWGLFGAGIYSRGSGEGLWKSDQHRLVFSLAPVPLMLLWIDDGPSQDLPPIPDAMTFYPAGLSVRTVGEDSRYAQVCWDPDLYRVIAPELPAPPSLDPAITFQDPLLGQLARSLAEETGHGAMDRLLAESLAAALAMRVARRFTPSLSPALPDLPRQRVRRVLDYIEAHLDAELTLAELADVACLSPYHFSRCFKRTIGVGPQRYTVQRRIERAKALIRRNDQTLAIVAAMVGFADQSHFTAVFRRETGMTPGRFRAASV